MVTISNVVLAFLCYSFLGWVLEAIVRLWCERRLVNPGFLTGPLVPIYAVGALAIQLSTAGVRDSPLLVFAIGVIVATAVEFIGHLLLQRLFGLVLWDYTGRLGSIKGRVCLVNSLGFGAAALVVVYLLDPLLRTALGSLPVLWTVALASALATVFLADWGHSIVSVLRVRPEIREFQGSLTRLRDQIDHQLASLGAEFDQAWARRRSRLLQGSRNTIARLEAAFPHARTSWPGHNEPPAEEDAPRAKTVAAEPASTPGHQR
ncbi:MAG: putative ABC transporter permease [Propionibacteriaceae bacterium]|nr:putative ABC transporter permease [Propionibacteriaceae bacterium]